MIKNDMESIEASMHLKTLVETMRKNKFHSKPRWFKVGDVVKWAPTYVNEDRVRGGGLAVVVKSEGPQVQVYWLGSGAITEHDVRIPQVFQLQDLAPMPEVAEWLKTIQREFA
tara:strand:+ start:645 stop:983 length:339 start_codon:yes stop_codon:yes gene_type:complete